MGGKIMNVYKGVKNKVSDERFSWVLIKVWYMF